MKGATMNKLKSGFIIGLLAIATTAYAGAISGWKTGATGGLDASEVADSCDSVRADIHDTAQVLRAEISDSIAAQNDVYVWAYRATTDQTIATATWTKIQFNAENMDLGNNFDPTTNYRFTAPDSGFYAISARANIQDDGGADMAGGSSIAIYRNDSMMVQGTALVGYITSDITNANYGPMVNAVIYCPASATIQIYAYQTFDAGGGLIKINKEETWVTIRKVN